MKRYISRYISKNWGLKLASLFLALILWFTLIPEEKTFSEKTLTVPLEIHNIPSTFEIVERPLQFVDVTIKAPNRLIPQISSANVHAVLDLQKASIAQTRYSLNPSMVSIPVGAEVKEIYPSQLSLKMELTEELLVNVEAVFVGTLQEGYKLSRIEIVPPQVLIKGPRSKLNENLKVQTSSIDRSLLIRNMEIEVDLFPPKDLRLMSPEEKVIVRLHIQKEENQLEESKNGNRPRN